ncbi:MAG: hypothetical protein Q9171_004311 [Xanthocarpia ochracea]
MSFYYNYTGPYPGTLRVNRANQTPAPTPDATPAAKPMESVNPWLAPAPQAAAPLASNQFFYYPRSDSQPAPAAQPELAKPVNPWLAPAPETPKASLSYAHRLHISLLQSETDDPAQPAATYQPQAPVYFAGHPIPEPAKIWYGSTKAEVDAQNAALAQVVGAQTPMNLVPANPGAGQQFWCKEPNGVYTLRTMTDIETSCQPGSWHTASTGYPYFVRKAE